MRIDPGLQHIFILTYRFVERDIYTYRWMANTCLDRPSHPSRGAEGQPPAPWRPGVAPGAGAKRLSDLQPKPRSRKVESGLWRREGEPRALPEVRVLGKGEAGRAGSRRMGAGSPPRFGKRGSWGPAAGSNPTSGAAAGEEEGKGARRGRRCRPAARESGPGGASGSGGGSLLRARRAASPVGRAAPARSARGRAAGGSRFPDATRPPVRGQPGGGRSAGRAGSRGPGGAGARGPPPAGGPRGVWARRGAQAWRRGAGAGRRERRPGADRDWVSPGLGRAGVNSAG